MEEEKTVTANGAKSEAIDSALQLLFFKATRKFNDSWLTKVMEDAAQENLVDLIVMAFHIRDIRGGKGERKLGREMFRWLAQKHPKEMNKVFRLIPEYGRFDDLKVLQDYAVTHYLACQLREDLHNMQEGKGISLAVKWLPKKEKQNDEIRKAICPTLTRTHFRKIFVSPLRKYLKLVETKMSEKKWDEIEYSHVPSQALQHYKKAFERHDLVRYGQWLESVKIGRAKVNVATLQPYQVVKSVGRKSAANPLAEVQWEQIEAATRKSGVFGDALVISDVSGSMTSCDGIPMDNSIAFGILISACSSGTFRNQVITFESNPSWVDLSTCATFVEKVGKMRSAPWGSSTNIEAVFRLILNRAQAGGSREVTKVPRRLFIFSDMQFDAATSAESTNFEAMKQMFEEARETMPEIVFWNLSADSGPEEAPVKKDERGTVLISGFSPIIAKYFLVNGIIDPQTCMNDTLNSKRYEPVRKALH